MRIFWKVRLDLRFEGGIDVKLICVLTLPKAPLYFPGFGVIISVYDLQRLTNLVFQAADICPSGSTEI